MRARSSMPSSTLRSAVWPIADEPVGRHALELGEPQVVRVEAGLLVVGVGVVAEQHPDRRVQHLDRDAVAILLDEARLRVPTARVQLVPADVQVRADLLAGRPAAAIMP